MPKPRNNIRLKPGMHIREVKSGTVWEVLHRKYWKPQSHIKQLPSALNAKVIIAGNPELQVISGVWPVGTYSHFASPWEAIGGFVLEYDEFAEWVQKVQEKAKRGKR